jgi:hypothetical protein
VHVHGYYKPDGTYVQEFIRSAPGTADTVISTTSRKPVNATTSAAANTATASAVASPTPTAHVDSWSGAQRDSNDESDGVKLPNMNLCE